MNVADRMRARSRQLALNASGRGLTEPERVEMATLDRWAGIVDDAFSEFVRSLAADAEDLEPTTAEIAVEPRSGE